MKIHCKSMPHDVSEIELNLYSRDFKCLWQILPPADENGIVTFDRNGRIYIDFQDTYEIDRFIDMLQRFKDASCRQLGWWTL